MSSRGDSWVSVSLPKHFVQVMRRTIVDLFYVAISFLGKSNHRQTSPLSLPHSSQSKPAMPQFNGVHLMLSPAASHSGFEDHMQGDQVHARNAGMFPTHDMHTARFSSITCTTRASSVTMARLRSPWTNISAPFVINCENPTRRQLPDAATSEPAS